MEGMLRDALAGLTLALTSVPQAVAYAEVSGTIFAASVVHSSLHWC